MVKSLVGFKQPSNTSGHSTEDVIAFVNKLKFACVGPEDSAVRGIFAESLDRLRVKSRKMQTLTMGDEKNMHELLQSLGLERLKPRLEEKWQVI
jgi:hypothetical protein